MKQHFLLNYLKTRSIGPAGVRTRDLPLSRPALSQLQALGTSGRKKERVPEGETWEGRGSACPEGPRKSFQLAFCEYGYFQLAERLPREKVTALGEKTVNQ